MSKIHFTWYLHDDEGFPYELTQAWTKVQEPELVTDELFARIEESNSRRPFYEVSLQCELDTETLEVKILSAS